MGGEPPPLAPPAQPTRPAISIDPETLDSILGSVLSDPEAGARRKEVLEADPREEAEIFQAFGAIDVLSEALCARILALSEAAEREQVEEASAEEIADEDVIEIETAFGGEVSGRTAATVGEAPEQTEATRRITEATMPAVPTVPRPERIDEERKAAALLYEDVLWLLSVNDGEGALISLERLLVLVNPSGEVKEFIELNETKLLNLYEGYIGPFDKVPSGVVPAKAADMPASYRAETKIAQLLAMVDGKLSIADLIREAPFSPLETCCVLNQLRRSALVEL